MQSFLACSRQKIHGSFVKLAQNFSLFAHLILTHVLQAIVTGAGLIGILALFIATSPYEHDLS